MWKVTRKGLAAQKLRLATTGLAVVLGVAFMAGTMVLTDTVGRTFDELFASAFEGTDARVRSASRVEADFVEQRERVDETLVADIRQVDGVAEVEGSIGGFAQIIGSDGDPIGDPGMGAPTFGTAWSASDTLNPFTLVEGRPPGRPGEVVIDRGSAERGDLDVDDRTVVVTQAGAVPVRIVGIARFGASDSPGGASFAMFTPEYAQAVVAEPGRFDAIDVVAEPGVSEEELRDRLAAALPDDLEVLTGAEIVTETQDDIREALGFFNTFLLTFAAVALFVGSFIIYNTFSIIVAQRTKEMALLRAVGASRRQVLGSIVGEAAVLGLLASAFGVAAGIGVAAGLKALLAGFGIDIPAGGIVLTSRTVVVAMVVGLGVTVVAAIAPARRASRVPPVAAMRDVALDTSGRSRRRVVLGAVVTAAGVALVVAGVAGAGVALVGVGALLTFLGIAALAPVIAGPVSRALGAPLPRLRGMTGTIARENALRNPKRTAATASALMVGVALVGFISIFATSAKASVDELVDANFAGDLAVDSGTFGFGGLPVELADRLAEVPGVEAAAGLGGTPAEVDGQARILVAVDPAAVGQVLDLDVASGGLGALDADALAVSQRAADDHGWTVGDEVPVRFAATGEQRLTVAAVYERRDVTGDYLISRAAFQRHSPDQFDRVVLVDVADDADLAATRSAVQEVVDDYPTATLQDRTEFKQAQADDINMMLNLVFVLLALAIVIALMGIANTLALSIFERTRELGLLRAVGMTRAQVRSAVRWEAVLIALLGTVMGLAVGAAFGWVMIRALADEGFSRFAVPVGTLVTIVVLAAAAGVLASIGPARRAARLDVLRAVTVE